MSLGLLPWRGYTGSYTSSTPCSIYCSRLTQFVLFCSGYRFSSSARSVTFNSMFPFLLHCLQGFSHARHFNNTIVPYQQPAKLHFKNTIVPYQLLLRLALRNVAVRLPRNTRVFSHFSRRCRYRYSTNTNVFTVRRTNTYKHAYIQADRHQLHSTGTLMWGSLRLTPTTSRPLPQGSGTKSLLTVLDQTTRKAGPLLIEVAVLLARPPPYCLISPHHLLSPLLHQELYVTK